MKSKRSFFTQIFFCFFAIVVLLSVILYANTVTHLKDVYYSNIRRDLKSNALILSGILERVDTLSNQYIRYLVYELGQNTGTRFTIIDKSGVVVGDSYSRADTMENHGGRKEVIAAFSGDMGYRIRYSSTEKVDYMYLAVGIRDSLVVRCSRPLTRLERSIDYYNSKLLKLFVLIVVIVIIISLFLSRMMSKPMEVLKKSAANLGKGDFDTNFRVTGPREIQELSDIMENAASVINLRFKAVKKHKQRINTILSEMVESVIAVNKNREIFLINTIARDMFDIRVDRIKGVNFYKVIRNVELQQVVDELLAGEPGMTITNRYIDLNVQGGKKTLQVNGKSIADNRDVVLVMHDITNLKRLENLRKDFAGNVSHELRTPFTAIKGFVETLKAGAIHDPEDARHFLTIIENEVNRLNTLIEDLLSLARIERREEAGDSDDFHPVRIGSVVESVHDGYMERAREESVTLQLEEDPRAADTEIFMNDSLLELALNNLVDNAIKYSGSNASVTLSLVRDDKYITLGVSDTGPGIPPEHRKRLFERFYRVDTSRSRSMGGTGLGLSIVKHIVSLHNGSVSIESSVGEGSTFIIKLPVTHTEEGTRDR
ncbi:MAG: sensor histidine kinase [Fibrobacterota bacterium]